MTHTQSVDDVCDKTVVLTRYLSKGWNFIYEIVVWQETDDALFWGYELYYSGFTDEVFEIVLRIYTAYYGTTTRCLKDIYAGLRRNGGNGVRTNLLAGLSSIWLLQDVAQRNRQTAEH
jgi:hypothetical protein